MFIHRKDTLNHIFFNVKKDEMKLFINNLFTII